MARQPVFLFRSNPFFHKFCRGLFLLLFTAVSFTSAAQTETTEEKTKKWYFTGGSEQIFSLANLEDNEYADSYTVRYSPVFNILANFHYDVNERFGLMTGLHLINVGFSANLTGSDTFKKFRTYNLGVPIGIKFGDLENDVLVYLGYSFELPIHYKEKTFPEDGDKEKYTSFFSNRVNLAHGWFLGAQFPFGVSLKFKYYLNNFFNQDYTTTVDGASVKPYEGADINVFYFAISFNIFKDDKIYFDKSK